MSETKKQRQFSEVIAKLDKIDAKLDEVLQRIPPNKPRLENEIVASASPRMDKNLGSL
jgi:hypothetical protein